jgi:peptidyl-prolyl cis-trans isomerase D
LNAKFSLDSVAKRDNGNLGTFAQGTMVGEFNDLCFYKAQIGKYYTLATRFGTHLVQVQSHGGKVEPRSKIAYLRVPMVPSDKTQKAAEEAAINLSSSNRTADAFNKAAQAAGLQVQTSSALMRNDYRVAPIGEGEGGRDMVKWAYHHDTKIGSVSPKVFAFKARGDNFVSTYAVGVLKSIVPKGIPSVAAAKEDPAIANAVRNKKKAEKLTAQLGNPSDLVALAQQFNTKVDTAKGVTFNANFIPNMGSEPKVIAAAFATPVGGVSAPIAGASGVFVLKVVNRAPTTTPADREQLRKQMASTISSSVRSKMMNSLKKGTKIEDNRAVLFQ